MVGHWSIVARVTGVVLVISGAITGTTAAADPGCIAMRGLTERIIDGSVNDISGPYPESIGDSATYFDRLFGPDGKQIATLYGKAHIAFNFPNGNVGEYSEERIEFENGGTIETQGYYDVTAGEQHVWQLLPAVGTGGEYDGMIGIRGFQIINMGDNLNTWIEMCPAGTDPV